MFHSCQAIGQWTDYDDTSYHCQHRMDYMAKSRAQSRLWLKGENKAFLDAAARLGLHSQEV